MASHVDLFFFISTIGFILLAVLTAILLLYLILLLRRWMRITKKVEEHIETVGEEARAFFKGVLESRLFAWIAGLVSKKRKGHRT